MKTTLSILSALLAAPLASLAADSAPPVHPTPEQAEWQDHELSMESSRQAGIQPGIYISWPANAYFEVDNGKVNFGKGGDPAKQAASVKAYEKLITAVGWGWSAPATERR